MAASVTATACASPTQLSASRQYAYVEGSYSYGLYNHACAALNWGHSWPAGSRVAESSCSAASWCWFPLSSHGARPRRKKIDGHYLTFADKERGE